MGRTDLNFENVYFFDLLDPKFLDFQVPRSPNFWISKSPDLQIPRFPGPQISRCPDAVGGATARRTLRSQPDPSPNAPRDQIHRKGPCCDQTDGARCWYQICVPSGARMSICLLFLDLDFTHIRIFDFCRLFSGTDLTHIPSQPPTN